MGGLSHRHVPWGTRPQIRGYARQLLSGKPLLFFIIPAVSDRKIFHVASLTQGEGSVHALRTQGKAQSFDLISTSSGIPATIKQESIFSQHAFPAQIKREQLHNIEKILTRIGGCSEEKPGPDPGDNAERKIGSEWDLSCPTGAREPCPSSSRSIRKSRPAQSIQ